MLLLFFPTNRKKKEGRKGSKEIFGSDIFLLFLDNTHTNSNWISLIIKVKREEEKMTKEDTWITTDEASLSTSSYFDGDDDDMEDPRHRRDSHQIKGGRGSIMRSTGDIGKGSGKESHYYSSDDSKASTGSCNLSSTSKSSSANGPVGLLGSGSSKKQPALAQQETRWLSKARFVLIVILFVATAQTAFCTYIFTRNVDRNDIVLKVRSKI